MRERSFARSAPVRVLLVISGALMIGSYMELSAHADDVTTTRTVEAPPAHHFGDRGDVVLPAFTAGSDGGALTYSIGGFSFEHSSTYDRQRQNQTTLQIAPSFDVFFARHWSIGGTATFSYQTFVLRPAAANPGDPGLDEGTVTAGIAPRIGYAIPLSEHVSIWPRLAVGATITGTLGTGAPDGALPPYNLQASLDVPVVYQIDRHFFASLGPRAAVTGTAATVGNNNLFFASVGGAFNLGFVL